MKTNVSVPVVAETLPPHLQLLACLSRHRQQIRRGHLEPTIQDLTEWNRRYSSVEGLALLTLAYLADGDRRG